MSIKKQTQKTGSHNASLYILIGISLQYFRTYLRQYYLCADAMTCSAQDTALEIRKPKEETVSLFPIVVN